MKDSQKFLKEKGLEIELPIISFKRDKTTGNISKHRVQLVKDKVDTIINQQGESVAGVKYLVLENEQPKQFFTASPRLIAKLGGYPEKSVVDIELKPTKLKDGNSISIYTVKEVKEDVRE